MARTAIWWGPAFRSGIAISSDSSGESAILSEGSTVCQSSEESTAYANDPSGGGNRHILAAQTPDAGGTWSYTDLTLDMGTGDADMPAITVMSAATAPTVGATVAWIDFRTSAFVNGDVYRARIGR